jgi:uncharacterized protein HemX
MKISENTSVALPIRNLLAIVMAVAVGVWAYFGIIERLNSLETKNQLFEQDLLAASKQLPIDQEQFMLLEHIAEQVEKLELTQEQNMTNKVNIERLQKDIDKILIDVEKLKDSVRANLGKLNGNSH